MKAREFFDRYIGVRSCGGCGELLSYEQARDAFCVGCRQSWDQAKTESCPTCFQAISECTCMPASLKKVGVLSLRKLTRYSTTKQEEPQNRILYSIKHHPNHRHTRFLVSELLPALREELNAAGVENSAEEAIILHMPRGRRAKNKYGFDQSELFCQILSEQTGIPHARRVIRRKIGGKEQKKLTKAQRQANLRGLLTLREEEAVRGKIVILFDDIVTTGASMAACASLLKKAGAKMIFCACISQV